MFRRHKRKILPTIVPRSVLLDTLGQANSSKDGDWTVTLPVTLGGAKVEVAFSTGERPPDNRELGFYHRIETNWTSVWQSVLRVLEREMSDDGPGGEREQFLRAVRPVWILIFETGGNDAQTWELMLEPNIYGHTVTMVMKDFDCKFSRLDG